MVYLVKQKPSHLQPQKCQHGRYHFLVFNNKKQIDSSNPPALKVSPEPIFIVACSKLGQIAVSGGLDFKTSLGHPF
jgi:hypothetical protein